MPWARLRGGKALESEREMTDEEKRGLDAFCAKSVLGLRAVKTVMGIEAGTFALVRHGQNKGTVFVHEHGNNIKPFKPTVCAADAMQVLEKCARHYSPECSIAVDIDVDGWSISEITVGKDYGMLSMASAQTLPLAIAKFACVLYSK